MVQDLQRVCNPTVTRKRCMQTCTTSDIPGRCSAESSAQRELAQHHPCPGISHHPVRGVIGRTVLSAWDFCLEFRNIPIYFTTLPTTLHWAIVYIQWPEMLRCLPAEDKRDAGLYIRSHQATATYTGERLQTVDKAYRMHYYCHNLTSRFKCIARIKVHLS